MKKKLENPYVFEANLLYLIIACLFITIGAKAQQREIYSGLIITEYLLVFFPVIIYLKLQGYSLKNVLKLNKISLKQALLVPLITIFSYPIGAFLNYIVVFILSNFVNIKPNPTPIPTNPKQLLISFLIISISAGICEEVMFRGMVMSSYQRLGIKKAIIISAVLFGMLHFNIQNFAGPTFLGIIFGLMVYKTNSLFTSIIAHATNNAFALILGYVITNAGSKLPTSSDIPEISQEMLLSVSIIAFAIIAIIMGFVAYSLYKLLPKSRKSRLRPQFTMYRHYRVNFLQYIPVIIVAVLYVYRNYIYLTI